MTAKKIILLCGGPTIFPSLKRQTMASARVFVTAPILGEQWGLQPYSFDVLPSFNSLSDAENRALAEDCIRYLSNSLSGTPELEQFPLDLLVNFSARPLTLFYRCLGALTRIAHQVSNPSFLIAMPNIRWSWLLHLELSMRGWDSSPVPARNWRHGSWEKLQEGFIKEEIEPFLPVPHQNLPLGSYIDQRPKDRSTLLVASSGHQRSIGELQRQIPEQRLCVLSSSVDSDWAKRQKIGLRSIPKTFRSWTDTRRATVYRDSLKVFLGLERKFFRPSLASNYFPFSAIVLSGVLDVFERCNTLVQLYDSWVRKSSPKGLISFDGTGPEGLLALYVAGDSSVAVWDGTFTAPAAIYHSVSRRIVVPDPETRARIDTAGNGTLKTHIVGSLAVESRVRAFLSKPPTRLKPVSQQIALALQPLGLAESENIVSAVIRALPNNFSLVVGFHPRTPIQERSYLKNAHYPQVDFVDSLFDTEFWRFSALVTYYSAVAFEAEKLGVPTVAFTADRTPPFDLEAAGVANTARTPEELARTLDDLCKRPTGPRPSSDTPTAFTTAANIFRLFDGL